MWAIAEVTKRFPQIELLVVGDGSQGIAEAVVELLDNDSLRKKLITGGLAKVQVLDWNNITKKYKDFFDAIITNATSRD